MSHYGKEFKGRAAIGSKEGYRHIIASHKQNTISPFFNIILIPLALLLLPFRLLGITFVRLDDTRIGHFANNTELFLRRIKLRMLPKRIYIGIASKTPCNTQILAMYKRRMTLLTLPKEVYRNRFFKNISYPKYILSKAHLYSNLSINSNEYEEFNATDPMISFTAREEKEGKKLLSAMGIRPGEPFVLFHSRDATYMRKTHRITRDDLAFRDSKIETYLPAAKWLSKEGFFALRMGHIVEKPLSLKDSRIIDYATRHRSDFGDAYLVAHCKFFLGNTAGICFLSHVFNMPLALANLIPIKYPPLGRNDLFIPKKIYSKKKKRILTFREIIEEDIIDYYDTDVYEKNGLVIINNTAEEILELCKEMNGRLDGLFTTTKEDERLQTQFKHIFRGSSCEGFPSRIGNAFLKKNKNLLT